MTLAAAILFFGISSLTWVDRELIAQSTPQSNSSASASAPQEQAPSMQTPTAATKPSTAQPTTQAPLNKPKESAAKKTRNKKRDVPAADCDPAPTSVASPGSSPAASQPAGSAQAPSTPEAQKNCPPSKKTIVPQGGITEQSIQLAGGSSDGDAKQKQQSTDQMLKETEENLKKVPGTQLSSDQQSSVSQIREFERQSKDALKAADYERAHTLAWKAKVLSDDLVTPKK